MREVDKCKTRGACTASFTLGFCSELTRPTCCPNRIVAQRVGAVHEPPVFETRFVSPGLNSYHVGRRCIAIADTDAFGIRPSKLGANGQPPALATSTTSCSPNKAIVIPLKMALPAPFVLPAQAGTRGGVRRGPRGHRRRNSLTPSRLRVILRAKPKNLPRATQPPGLSLRLAGLRSGTAWCWARSYYDNDHSTRLRRYIERLQVSVANFRKKTPSEESTLCTAHRVQQAWLRHRMFSRTPYNNLSASLGETTVKSYLD